MAAMRLRRPAGQWRLWLLKTPLYTLAAYAVCFYLLTALLFAAMYSVVPKVAATCDLPAVGFVEALHFSLTTQSTTGYGDYHPCSFARWVAAIHELLSLAFNATAFGVIAYRIVRREARPVVPAVVTYNPNAHQFRFRFINSDADDMTDISLTAVYVRPPYSAKRVALSWNETAYVPSTHVMAVDSISNGGGRRPEPLLTEAGEQILTPDSFFFTDARLIIDVSGVYVSTGEPALSRAEFVLGNVRCGSYREIVDSRRSDSDINAFVSTDPQSCQSCSFHGGCQLDVARLVRAGARGAV